MSKEVSHYVVTAHPPGGVLHAVKCNFLAPDSEVRKKVKPQGDDGTIFFFIRAAPRNNAKKKQKNKKAKNPNPFQWEDEIYGYFWYNIDLFVVSLTCVCFLFYIYIYILSIVRFHRSIYPLGCLFFYFIFVFHQSIPLLSRML